MIRGAGLRSTGSRIAVLRHLHGAGKPMTHAEIAERVADQGFDRATVYRNLMDLTSAGLIQRTDLGDHVWRFEFRAHSDRAHPHFLCTDCGVVSCLPSGSVRLSSAKGTPRAVAEHAVVVQLRGVCDNCL